MAWRIWTTRKFQNTSWDLRVCNEFRWLTSLALDPGHLSPSPLCSVLCELITSLALLLLSPTPSTFRIPGPGDLEPPFSLVPINHNLASQLFQTLPFQDPLWGSHPEPDLEEAHGTGPRFSWTPTYSFSEQPFPPLCQGLFH